jgi:two-component system cell cycle sensor histidine kinase/response regulator CckA
LVTDANMPGMSGIELVSALAPERPDLRIIVMSGYTEELTKLAGLADRVTLLPKPFTPKELRQSVAAILSGKIA